MTFVLDDIIILALLAMLFLCLDAVLRQIGQALISRRSRQHIRRINRDAP